MSQNTYLFTFTSNNPFSFCENMLIRQLNEGFYEVRKFHWFQNVFNMI